MADMPCMAHNPDLLRFVGLFGEGAAEAEPESEGDDRAHGGMPEMCGPSSSCSRA